MASYPVFRRSSKGCDHQLTHERDSSNQRRLTPSPDHGMSFCSPPPQWELSQAHSKVPEQGVIETIGPLHKLQDSGRWMGRPTHLAATKTTLGSTFPCLLNQPPTHLERSASFFGFFLSSVLWGQFANQQLTYQARSLKKWALGKGCLQGNSPVGHRCLCGEEWLHVLDACGPLHKNGGRPPKCWPLHTVAGREMRAYRGGLASTAHSLAPRT